MNGQEGKAHSAGGGLAGLRFRWCVHVCDQQGGRQKDSVSISILTAAVTSRVRGKFKYLLDLFKNEGEMEHMIYRCISVAMAVTWALHWTVVVGSVTKTAHVRFLKT